MPKVGILSIPPSLEEMTWLAREAEAAGFDSVWTGEYFSRNAFTTLAAMALATKRITIGSSIAYAFLRSPVQLAMAAADVDELSQGRLVLGLGPGARSQNQNWYGVPFEHPGPKLKETVEIARSLWSVKSGPFRHEGRFYQLSIPNFVRPHQARDLVPIYLGAVNPYMLRLTGQVADGLLGHPTYTRSYYREVVLPALEQGARQRGRNRGDVATALGVVAVVDRDGRQARRDAATWLVFYYVARAFHTILDYHGWEGEKQAIVNAFRAMDPGRMADAISERMWQELLVLAGTPDEVRRQWQDLSHLADQVNLFAPAPYGGLSYERYQENYHLLLELFGRRT